MTKTLVNKFTIIEFVEMDSDPDKVKRTETGWVEVYDDYSIEWEYTNDGKQRPHVIETIRQFQKMDDYTRYTGGGGHFHGDDETVVKEMTPSVFAKRLSGALRSKDAPPRETFEVIRENV